MILLRMAIATVCVRLTAPSLPAAFARCCSVPLFGLHCRVGQSPRSFAETKSTHAIY